MNVLIITNKKKTITGPKRWELTLTSSLNDIEDIHVFTKVRDLYKVDVIHFYEASSKTILIMMFAKILKKKTVFTLHGDYIRENADKRDLVRIFWKPIHKLCLQLSDFVTYPSKYLSEHIGEGYRSKIIYNGVFIENATRKYEKNEIGLDGDELMLLTATNFNLQEKIKGLDTLINAYQEFKVLHPKSVLVVLGKGKYLEAYRERYKDQSIIFEGYRDDVIELINTCDLFLYYSYLDNLPYVILEALALGKPIQALAVGGLPEVLPKEYITEGNITIVEKQNSLPIDISAQRMANEFIEVYKNLK